MRKQKGGNLRARSNKITTVKQLKDAGLGLAYYLELPKGT